MKNIPKYQVILIFMMLTMLPIVQSEPQLGNTTMSNKISNTLLDSYTLKPMDYILIEFRTEYRSKIISGVPICTCIDFPDYGIDRETSRFISDIPPPPVLPPWENYSQYIVSSEGYPGRLVFASGEYGMGGAFCGAASGAEYYNDFPVTFNNIPVQASLDNVTFEFSLFVSKNVQIYLNKTIPLVKDQSYYYNYSEIVKCTGNDGKPCKYFLNTSNILFWSIWNANNVFFVQQHYFYHDLDVANVSAKEEFVFTNGNNISDHRIVKLNIELYEKYPPAYYVPVEVQCEGLSVIKLSKFSWDRWNEPRLGCYFNVSFFWNLSYYSHKFIINIDPDKEIYDINRTNNNYVFELPAETSPQRLVDTSNQQPAPEIKPSTQELDNNLNIYYGFFVVILFAISIIIIKKKKILHF